VGKKDTFILAIESSCDDTSAAVLKNETILSNLIAGQAVHEQYGGVVPELASRAHLKHIVPVVDQAIKKAGIELNDLDAIAFTKGPGLMGSLLVGVSYAKAIAMSLGVPLPDSIWWTHTDRTGSRSFGNGGHRNNEG
jgi:N6-L-threonylcarbamoyladenine synthase